MPKKTLLGIGVVIILIAIGALIFFKKQPEETLPNQIETKTTEGAQKDTPAPAPATSAITSIKDAMGLGKAMQCTYSMDDGVNTIQSTIIVEGKRFRASSSANGDMMNIISDGTTHYLWSDKTKQGFKIDTTCLDNLQKTVPENGTETPSTDPEDISKIFDNAKNVSCESAPVNESSIFTVPTDIQFIDQCTMIQETAKKLNNASGTNFKMPETIPNMPPVQQ